MTQKIEIYALYTKPRALWTKEERRNEYSRRERNIDAMLSAAMTGDDIESDRLLAMMKAEDFEDVRVNGDPEKFPNLSTPMALPSTGKITAPVSALLPHSASTSGPAAVPAPTVTPPTTSVGPSMLTVPASKSYQFPHTDPKYRSVLEVVQKADYAKLLKFIGAASTKLNPDGSGIPLTYTVIRETFCAASIALNESRIFPPRIRDTRKFKSRPTGAKASLEDSQISNDRQVIDLHWLFCNKQGNLEDRWIGIFDSDGFDFEMASTFVREVGTAENKSQALNLSDQEQFALAVLQEKRVANAWRGIQDGKRKVMKAATAAVTGSTSRLPAATAAILPDAYVALRVANGSPTSAVPVYRQLTGTEIPASKLSTCKGWLKGNGLL